MKKILTLTAILMIGGLSLLAQAPPVPPSSANNGGTNGPVGGGGAPIGSGLVILLSLCAGFGTKKVYDFKKRNPDV
jgi:hypothetical protein